jgi:hypothetical protein
MSNMTGNVTNNGTAFYHYLSFYVATPRNSSTAKDLSKDLSKDLTEDLSKDLTEDLFKDLKASYRGHEWSRTS